MPKVGFELAVSAGKRPQTYALDRVATATGIEHLWGIKKTFGVSLSICWSPVTTLFAFQVYRFCELCRGIMNYPVQIFMYLRVTSKYLDTKITKIK
jgi:hypothetical protein